MLCDDVFDRLTRGPFPAGDPQDEAVEAHLEQCDSCRQLALALEPAVSLFHEALGAEAARDLPAYWGRQSQLFAGEFATEEPDCGEDIYRELDRGYDGYEADEYEADYEPAAMEPIAAFLARPEFVESQRLDTDQRPGWQSAALAAAVLIGVTGAITLGMVKVGEQYASQASTSQLAAVIESPAASEEPLVIDLAAACLAGQPHQTAHERANHPSTLANVVPGPQVSQLALRLAGFAHQLPLSAADASRLQCCTFCHAADSDSAPAQQVSAQRVIKSCQACHLAMK